MTETAPESKQTPPSSLLPPSVYPLVSVFFLFFFLLWRLRTNNADLVVLAVGASRKRGKKNTKTAPEAR